MPSHSVADVLNKCFYVDDFFGGANSIAEARSLMRELSPAAKYDFELRKWTSSDPELTLELPFELREISNQPFSGKYQIKALGICWKPISNTFVFLIDLDDIENMVKGTLLSDLSGVFDPIGWIAPMIIAFKCLIHQTWVEGVS